MPYLNIQREFIVHGAHNRCIISLFLNFSFPDTLFSLIIFIYVTITFLYVFYAFCWRERTEEEEEGKQEVKDEDEEDPEEVWWKKEEIKDEGQGPG